MLVVIILLSSCNQNKNKMETPVAKKIEKELTIHEHTRIDNYYWMTLGRGNTVHLYTVKLDTNQKEVVLHEDELRAYRK